MACNSFRKTMKRRQTRGPSWLRRKKWQIKRRRSRLTVRVRVIVSGAGLVTTGRTIAHTTRNGEDSFFRRMGQ
jgi:hypothetical protein